MIAQWTLALAAAGAILGVGAAAAQQATQLPPTTPPLDLALPAPADTGKGRPFMPPLDAAQSPDCAAVLACRLRVYGAVQHNGAVELNAALFKW
jgi:hypothetical protein